MATAEAAISRNRLIHGKLVAVANGVLPELTRPLDWLHLPVPKSGQTKPISRPSRNSTSKHDTELYLGLVHMVDGIPGTQARIAVARDSAPRFGVATRMWLWSPQARNIARTYGDPRRRYSPIH